MMPKLKLSIIIGAYKAQDFIEECLDSIQNQTAFSSSRASLVAERSRSVDYEILIGVDGCLPTLKKLLLIKHKYDNLHIFWMNENKGVYITFNTLLAHASGSHVVFFGADDVMFPDMVENMFSRGAPLVIRHHGIQFLERSIFKLTGGFMPWRCSADTEHLSRVSRVLGEKVPITEYMYTYRSHPGQLTKAPETALNSNLRAGYVQLINSGIIPTTINPIMHDKYCDIDSEAFKKIIVPEDIHFGIASFPEREKSLSETVNSLYDQVDYLHIYLNNYKTVPEFLNKPKIKTYLSSEFFGDLGDVGKFFAFFNNAAADSAYFLTGDDDIIYSKDYVKHIIDGINKYKRRSIISIHGRTFTNYPVKSYYKDNALFYPCLRENKSDIRVHFCGTGVMGWHSSTIMFQNEHFSYINMADIFVSSLAHSLNIPLIIITHPANLVSESKSFNRDLSICRTAAHADSVQTDFVNKAYSEIKRIFEIDKSNYSVSTAAQDDIIHHVITTRLIYDDKNLLKARIELMKKILIPALKAQTNQNFVLAVRCYDSDLELIKSHIDFPFINFESYDDYLLLCKKNKWNIQTRHDSDDYMSPDYIAFIQYEVGEKKLNNDKFLLQFQPIKLDYNSGKILPLPDYYDTCNSGFLTLYQNDIIHSIYERAHTEMWTIAPKVFTYPRGYVKYFIHGKNDSLLPREVRLKQKKF